MTEHPSTRTFPYRAFILRVWCEGNTGTWRASVESIGDKKRILFNTLEQLCIYILTLDEPALPIITSDMATVNDTSATPPPRG